MRFVSTKNEIVSTKSKLLRFELLAHITLWERRFVPEFQNRGPFLIPTFQESAIPHCQPRVQNNIKHCHSLSIEILNCWHSNDNFIRTKNTNIYREMVIKETLVKIDSLKKETKPRVWCYDLSTSLCRIDMCQTQFLVEDISWPAQSSPEYKELTPREDHPTKNTKQTKPYHWTKVP